MKILIAYYSKTGNTEKVAGVIKKELEGRGYSVDVEKIKPSQEHSALTWFFIRIFKRECTIQEPKIKDVSKYDAICIGSPNWTRVSLPIARYLQELKGLKYKNVDFFSTTFLPPPFEWYIFSAYLLDLSLYSIIEKKGGRVMDNILLSSVFKRWDFSSGYGVKAIKNFCKAIETPISSFKEYALKEKEIEENRFIVVILLVFNLYFLFFQIISSIFKSQIITWKEFLLFLIISFFVYFSILTITVKKKGVFLGKYIASAASILVWTLVILFLELTLGRVIILGYLLIMMATLFSRNIKTVFFSGFCAILGYLYLFFNYPFKGILVPILDLTIFFLSVGIISFVANSLQKHFLGLLEARDETEEAKMALEIKIAARTNELKEMTESLEEKVKERTTELQEKIEELVKFNRIAIGRELKMVELKKEIAALKAELNKNKL